MVHCQRTRYILTNTINRSESEDESDDVGGEEQDGVLADEGVRLGCGCGELVGRPEEEI